MLINLYRRLDRVQSGLVFRVLATIVAAALCSGVFGALLAEAYDVQSQRTALFAELSGKSVGAGDRLALDLAETGTVTIDDRTYGGPHVRDRLGEIFDQRGAIVAPVATALLIADQYPAWAPQWLISQPDTIWVLGLAALALLTLIIWMNVTVQFVLTVAATAVPVAVSLLVGRIGLAWALGGIGLLTFTFLLLSRFALALLNRPNQVFAVAHTVIKEASRSRISLIFIILVLVMLPLLPLWLDPEAPLRFRVQTFISRSVGWTFIIAAFMTLVLATATVAFEIRDRQIWQIMTKPVNRLSYLVGKWLGVATVNAILLTVAGLATFVFIQYLRTQPADYVDAEQLVTEVLTARIASEPMPRRLTGEQLQTRVQQFIERDSELAVLEEVPLSTRREIRWHIQQQYEQAQRSIPPGQTKHFTFTGLERARQINAPLTLRYRFYILGDDEHRTFPAVFIYNGDPETARQSTYVPTVMHTDSIPPTYVTEEGTLTVGIFNSYQLQPSDTGNGAINIERGNLELLYTVGSFEANFLRAMLLMWLKLAFLAMLGIGCATFLSFPVAMLLSLTVLVGASSAPFMATALEQFAPPPAEDLDLTQVDIFLKWLFSVFVTETGQFLVFSLREFGEFSPTRNLVEGLLVPWREVAAGVLKLGGVWSGIVLGFAYLVIRNRQLAIYSGHG